MVPITQKYPLIKKFNRIIAFALDFFNRVRDNHPIDAPNTMENTMSPKELAALAEATHRGDAAYAAKQVAK
ncbi:hypothetical protein GTP38_11130 [Duganella sp. FT94W]|uniref:Uncharacterized protein n=1 Tax=Duganella lactea TaxID=2692173 RepID=A0ABW9VB82_9BURK|nr:hypothetical protein [Duganella lactea]MYM34892.1 hypothetical protein [Duganella lactea]